MSPRRRSKYATYESEIPEKLFQQRVIQYARLNGFRIPREDPLAPPLDLIMHIFDSRKSTGTGFPDLVLVHPGRCEIWFCELKTERGRLSPDQKLWKYVLEEIDRTVDAIHYRLWRPSDWDGIVREISGGRGQDSRLFV